MFRAPARTTFKQFLQRVPLPLMSILIGLLCGFAVWFLLDPLQSNALRAIFREELRTQLDQRARESLIRFDQYLVNYSSTTRLLANHRRLAQYLEPLAWFSDEEIEPVLYTDFQPYWLPGFLRWRSLIQPSHVLLVDTRGRIREIYQLRDIELPESLSPVDESLLDESQARGRVVMLDGEPYLIVSHGAEDSGGFNMGYLLVVVPVDQAFLTASQHGVSLSGTLVALLDGDEQRLLASSDPVMLPPGDHIDDRIGDYEVTAQAFVDYEGFDLNMQFATFVPRARIEETTQRVLELERRQRIIEATVFVLIFTLLIYLVSARLNRVVRRISNFSQRALGFQQPVIPAGNQLLLLEDWVRQFIGLVRLARDEMRLEHETQMRETEALKSAIMETSMDSIITIDGKGKIIEFNPRAEKAFNYGREEAIDHNLADLIIVEKDRERFKEMLDSCLIARDAAETRSRGEVTAVRAGGTKLPVEVSIMPILLESRLVFTIYLHDISERKQAEREIQSLAKFASESPSPILRVNARGVIIYANAASEPLLAYWGRGRAQTLPLFWFNRVSRALEAGRDVEFEVTVGEQIYSLLMAPIVELGYVNIYGRDISAVRVAEQQSRRHQSELVHVCRLSTMGEMATGLAHELNQPLSAIVNFANGCTRRLQRGIGGRSDLIEALDQIASQAERAGEIIRRLRGLVGKQPPVRSTVDLNDLVREVCSFVESEVRNLGLEIEMDLMPNGLPVRADLVQIEQVLLNLIRNALDALQDVAPEKRRLTVRTRNEGKHSVRVTVEDSGPGIDDVTMAHLFEAFYTTKESGMGMGLPISKTIIDDHSGRIWAKSRPGRGTRFVVILPTALELPETAEIAGIMR